MRWIDGNLCPWISHAKDRVITRLDKPAPSPSRDNSCRPGCPKKSNPTVQPARAPWCSMLSRTRIATARRNIQASIHWPMSMIRKRGTWLSEEAMRGSSKPTDEANRASPRAGIPRAAGSDCKDVLLSEIGLAVGSILLFMISQSFSRTSMS